MAYRLLRLGFSVQEQAARILMTLISLLRAGVRSVPSRSNQRLE
jgi:hypothetical protein